MTAFDAPAAIPLLGSTGPRSGAHPLKCHPEQEHTSSPAPAHIVPSACTCHPEHLHLSSRAKPRDLRLSPASTARPAPRPSSLRRGRFQTGPGQCAGQRPTPTRHVIHLPTPTPWPITDRPQSQLPNVGDDFRLSGLRNNNHVDETYDPSFLSVMESCIDATTTRGASL